jgi:predicted alternative tryptophan synthase beta-subunit
LADGPHNVTFENQQSVLKKAFPTTNVPIVQLSKLGVQEQIELVSQKTAIFVATCGGGSMTATFLPPIMTLILYYQQMGGFDFMTVNMISGPTYLD